MLTIEIQLSSNSLSNIPICFHSIFPFEQTQDFIKPQILFQIKENSNFSARIQLNRFYFCLCKSLLFLFPFFKDQFDLFCENIFKTFSRIMCKPSLHANLSIFIILHNHKGSEKVFFFSRKLLPLVASKQSIKTRTFHHLRPRILAGITLRRNLSLGKAKGRKFDFHGTETESEDDGAGANGVKQTERGGETNKHYVSILKEKPMVLMVGGGERKRLL